MSLQKIISFFIICGHAKLNLNLFIYCRILKGLNLISISFPCGAVVKNLPSIAGDTREMGSIPESGRCPGVGNDSLLQYSCLENCMDRGAWWATVHGFTKSRTQLTELNVYQASRCIFWM